ncbi:MAG: hypothetical protein A3A94_03285 [Candidatus Portnoybacteria bacterium RIFCSPLOWO2_01_FULL_43_11]|uniref:UPF0235 protein A3E90_00295 n=2 Tax=Candidatus Portnoyibacteriota TaxID=1817913 RepID=A0A1G2FIT4_9BACT|nr:MAG: hypothetical protein A3E90_00295 [Candidatus Portnoybacteria bacterium RIFCSPHIGHO2_12_FULL_40_11]OGZ38915.1 MAG: hypothetical protein A3A94_03285 [Candidatus Portnoybacteria bacterium RIFCSPLOWO2_01_FULL_43_11]
MKLFVSAKPGSREESVRKIDDAHFAVAVKEPPIEGRANKAIIKALADFLNVAPSRLSMISGQTSRQKIIEFLNK